MSNMKELDEQAMKDIHGGITFVYGKLVGDFNPQPEPPGDDMRKAGGDPQ